MASSIIATTIDETFPVAGIDNDSQGFRDNFTIIKDNFTSAKSEIETLQSDTAKVNVDNDFDNNTISQVNLKQITQEFNNSVVGDADRELSFSGGHFYLIDDVSANITVTLADWPDTDEYAEMYIQLSGNGASTRNVTLASKTPSDSASTRYTDDNDEWSGAIIQLGLTTTESKVIKAWTTNGGVSVYFEFLGTYNQV